MALAYTGLFLFLLFVYFDPSLFLPVLGPMRVAFLLSGGTLAIAFANGGRPPRSPQTKLLLVFLALGFLSAWTSPWRRDPLVGASLAYLYNSIGLYFLVALVVSWERNLHRYFHLTLILAAVIASVTFATARMGIGPMKEGDLYRMTNYFGGIGDDPNEFGAFLIALLPVPLTLLRRARSPVHRAALFAVALVFILCIVRTRSRGAFIGLLVVTLLMLWQYRKRVIAWVIVAAVGGFIIAHTHESYWERLGTMKSMQSLQEEDSAESRMLQIGYASRLMQKYPLLGVGPGAYVQAKLAVLNLDPDDKMSLHVAHNSYMEVGAQLGIPALIVFLLSILVSLRGAWRAANYFDQHEPNSLTAVIARSVWIGLAGLAVAIFFLSEEYNQILYQWFAVAATLNVMREKAEAQRVEDLPAASAAAP